ncbi:MAG: hypothetical protein E6G56_05135 [Actinobacteria bacterium]|nr:MAG: hypothetical protein E6G56_05135 [Actinomycetota bacterium]
MHGAGRSLGPGAEPSAAAAGPSAPSRPRPGAIHRRAHERALLHRIARCESSFRPGLIYDAGRYRGAFQFDIETWRSVGGRGDPAAAPPSEQRRRALILLRRRGLRPWPVCGPRAANRP